MRALADEPPRKFSTSVGAYFLAEKLMAEIGVGHRLLPGGDVASLVANRQRPEEATGKPAGWRFAFAGPIPYPEIAEALKARPTEGQSI
jgi:hypothetical protein